MSEARTLRSPGFRILWSADGISQFSAAIVVFVLPLLAVTVLQAEAFDVGVLTAVGFLAWPLLGLPAGVMIDRAQSRRAVLVAANAVRAGSVLVVTVAAATGSLSTYTLYGCALLISVATVFFDIAYQAYLPTLLIERDLVGGNARLEFLRSAAVVAGPGLAGVAVDRLSGVGATTAVFVGFAVSAVLLTLIRVPEQPGARLSGRGVRSFGREIREGMAYVWSRTSLRAAAIVGGATNFFLAAFEALAVLFLVRGLGLGSASAGVLLGVAAVGGLLGAAVVPRLRPLLGTGAPLIWVPLMVAGPFALLTPLSSAGWGVVLFALGGAIPLAGVVANGVGIATLVQTTTPDEYLSRVGSSVRLLSRGALPLGALAAGAVAQAAGLTAAMWMVGAGLALSPLLAIPALRAGSSTNHERSDT